MSAPEPAVAPPTAQPAQAPQTVDPVQADPGYEQSAAGGMEQQAQAGGSQAVDPDSEKVMGAQVEELPPFTFEGDKAHIDDFLKYVVAVKSSDLHVKTGSPPTIRMSGHLEALDFPVIDHDTAHELANQMMEKKQVDKLEEMGEVDFAYSVAGLGRFRVNIHKQRGSLGIAARRILPGAPDFKDLGLPKAIEELAKEHRGLLLVTGPTSSGKTTTCGAILKYINQTRRAHIVTIEDPIEILHKDEMSVVTQREVGQDTTGFHPALRAAMRQDPDVIFVGEIRDTETVSAALQAAETGHFVLATLHTTDVVETVNRVVDFFPSAQQKQIRVALAGSLVGVITQRLLPKVGGGRAPAIEVLVMNGRVRDCILDPDKTHVIHEIVADSGYYGMQTFDQALIGLFQQGLVTLEDAKNAANSPHDFELALQKQGLLRIGG
jgi:twitching motility protein PilT